MSGKAEPGDVLIEMSCPCDSTPVLVREASVPTWRCQRKHEGTPTAKWMVRGRVLTLDVFEPEGLDRIESL